MKTAFFCPSLVLLILNSLISPIMEEGAGYNKWDLIYCLQPGYMMISTKLAKKKNFQDIVDRQHTNLFKNICIL